MKKNKNKNIILISLIKKNYYILLSKETFPYASE